MTWLIAVTILVILAAIASIWGTVDDRRDLGTGRPSLDTLMSYTGIAEREVFVGLLGEPDAMGRFELPPGKLRDLPRATWVRILDSTFADAASIVLSCGALVLWSDNSSLAVACLAVAAGIQMLGYGIAALLTYRSRVCHRWLIEEEDHETGNEQSHAPQPAVGPTANGKPSPPAQ